MKKNQLIRFADRFHLKELLLAVLFIWGAQHSEAQTVVNTTIPAGSFIVNMGVVPQTVGNGLKPYGMVYELLQNKCLVHWVIKPNKAKDGADFTYNNIDYKGGTFVIPAEFRTPAINTILAKWVGSTIVPGYGTYAGVGVQGITTTSPVTVPVYLTFQQIPRWTMDLKNGGIATAFFANAGIPPSAYGGSDTKAWKTPAMLDCCDDVFVMPHADPIWLTHSRLFDWVQGVNGCKGGVWLGCHAGSALENMFDNITTDGDPIDASQQTNFLVEKTANAVGAGPWSNPGNSLILWGSHDDGTLPYTFNSVYAGDPVGQFMGSTDAAQLNGSEQIYIPAHASAGWRTNTKVLVYDPDHPDAKSYPNTPLTHVGSVMAYGPAFGVTGNGKIFLEAGHNIAGTAPANIAAQRAFLNYSFLVAWEKAVVPALSPLPTQMYSGSNYNLSFNQAPNVAPEIPNTYTIQWASSCGGTFSPNSTSSSVTFTPPTAVSPTLCNISVTITDLCGRTTFDTHTTTISCNLQAAATITNPCNGSTNGGAIGMTFTGGSGPYKYTWTKTGGTAPFSGSGTLSTAPYTISGLSAGTYTVTVTSDNGNGCPVTLTSTLSESPAMVVTPTYIQPTCFGASNGAININVSGGTPGYTYKWLDGPTTPNWSGLAAGTYSLTVTDAKGCTSTTTINLTQPAALAATPTVTPVSCYNAANGSITLAVSGGTAPYSYLWNDGSALQNRTGLSPGTYSVTVTDAKGCTTSLTDLVITQPAAALAATETHVNATCYGSSTGSIDLTVTGGTETYSYTWTGPNNYTAATQNISGLKAGTYNVTVTDARGCTTNRQVVITQPAAMALTTSATQPTCPPTATLNYSDGKINLTVNGGTSPYTYAWTATGTGVVPTGQASQQNLTTLVAGTYTVTVTDSKSCAATTSVTLNYLNPTPAKPGTINH